MSGVACRWCAVLLSVVFSLYSYAGSNFSQEGSEPVPSPVTALQNGVGAEYLNASEGLQKFITDLLFATKKGDKQRVDALIKKTEFPDYESWFLHTYREDPDTAGGWASSYKHNVDRNEGLFRELLSAVAKDDAARVLVRKVSDSPEPDNGLEWGMLRYARNPVDIYCVTLVATPPNSEAIESSGYFVYVDGMFRWENLADFKKPGSYRSAPSKTWDQKMAALKSGSRLEETVIYSNTPEGLHQYLADLFAATKVGDGSRVTELVKQAEIPDYRNWYLSLFVPGSALSWANPYGRSLEENRNYFQGLFQKLANDKGEITVRKLADRPGDSSRGYEWGMLHNSRTALDIYHAEWKSKNPDNNEWFGNFYYVDGMFRREGGARIVKVPIRQGGGSSFPPGGVMGSIVSAAPNQPSRVRVSAGVAEGLLLEKVMPHYPAEAKSNHVQGQVVLRAIIDRTGQVKGLSAFEGPSLLVPVTIDAVKQWKYRPYLLNGQPVEIETTVVINFALSK